ncbi:MAG: Inositol hexakisphosphate kinase 1, partial [Paramarteilia canceri]
METLLFLISDGSDVLVKIFRDHTSSSLNEAQFYELMNKCSGTEHFFQLYPGLFASDEVRLTWLSFMPKFYGRRVLKDDEIILIENLVSSRNNSACAMDLKIGQFNAPQENADSFNRKLAKFPLREKIGFSLDGIYIHEKKIKKSKQECRALSCESIFDLLKAYVTPKKDLNVDLINALLKKLNILKELIGDANNRFRLYSASLLVVYDSSSYCDLASTLRVSIIDFEHTKIVEKPC